MGFHLARSGANIAEIWRRARANRNKKNVHYRLSVLRRRPPYADQCTSEKWKISSQLLRQITQKFCLRMRIWRYQSPNPCYAKEDLELFFICPALSSKPQKPWCPWSYLEITVAEPRPPGNAFVCQLWQGPKRRMTFRSIVLLITFIRWLRWSIYIYSKTTRLRHTNEMQWTNWLPLTRKRYKALNVTCMLCLCVSAMATVMIFSQIPLILIWQTSLEEPEPPRYTPSYYFCWIHNFLVWKPLRKSLGSVPFITFFAWKLPWSSGEAGITFPWN